jgi:hypothetical protein
MTRTNFWAKNKSEAYLKHLSLLKNPLRDYMDSVCTFDSPHVREDENTPFLKYSFHHPLIGSFGYTKGYDSDTRGTLEITQEYVVPLHKIEKIVKELNATGQGRVYSPCIKFDHSIDTYPGSKWLNTFNEQKDSVQKGIVKAKFSILHDLFNIESIIFTPTNNLITFEKARDNYIIEHQTVMASLLLN